MRRLCLGAGILFVLLGAGATMGWSNNSCVDCHKRAETVNALPAWYQDQFIHWYGSVHGKKNITCEKCHGGQPFHANKKLAHKGVRPPTDPKSRINYKNLPETCGSCHKGIYQQFVQSSHYKNLKDDRLAPTCTTCHGFQMDIGAVTPLQLVGRCTICHSHQQGVKPEVVNLARQALEGIAQIEHTIQKAQVAVELVREQGLESKDAEKALGTVREHLERTGDLWHNFHLGVFRQELTEIQAAADKVYTAAKRAMLKE